MPRTKQDRRSKSNELSRSRLCAVRMYAPCGHSIVILSTEKYKRWGSSTDSRVAGHVSDPCMLARGRSRYARGAARLDLFSDPLWASWLRRVQSSGVGCRNRIAASMLTYIVPHGCEMSTSGLIVALPLYWMKDMMYSAISTLWVLLSMGSKQPSSQLME